MEEKRINTIEFANKLITDNYFNFEVVKSNLNISDYTKENLMELILTKIGSTCHKSDKLVEKASKLLNLNKK